MESSNPALRRNPFRSAALESSSGEVMTLQGTVNKSFFLVLLTFAGAYYSFNQALPNGWQYEGAPAMPGWFLPVVLGNLLLSLVIIFVKRSAPLLAPIYAVAEGLTLGLLSALFERRYPGIAFQAMLCTIGTFVAVLLAYKAGWVRASERFVQGLSAAMLGIMLVYLIDFGMNFFGHRAMPYIHSGGTFGILVSVVITAVAALNLVLDFALIEDGARMGAPKYMEWYSSFALLVTLVWLYLEMLRLLGKGRER